MQSIGFNINCDMPGDMGFLTEMLQEWEPAWTLVMTTGDGLNDQAWHVYNTVSAYGGHVIYRHFEYGEGHLWEKYTVEQQLERQKRWMNGYPVWINVGNEPRPGKDQIQVHNVASYSPTALAVSDYKLTAQQAEKAGRWYANLLYRGAENDVLTAAPSFATGNYEQHELQWWDELWWAFIDTANFKHDGQHMNIFAVHEYDFGMPMMNTAGSSPRALIDPAYFRQNHLDTNGDIIISPDPYDVFYGNPEENWLVYRSWWVVERMRGLINDPDWNNISIVRTEGLHDRPPHMPVAFPDVVGSVDAMAGQEASGLISLKRYFHEYGKNFDMTAEHLAACGLGWVDWVDANSEDIYKATNIFTWSDNHNYPEQWAQRFGIQKWPALLRYYPKFHKMYIQPMIDGGVEVPDTEPTPEPPPIPDPSIEQRLDALTNRWIEVTEAIEDLQTNAVHQSQLEVALKAYVRSENLLATLLDQIKNIFKK